MLRKAIRATDGETVAVQNQWAAETKRRATTVSASAWAFTGSGTITGETLVTPLASCKLAPKSCGTLTNTATLANGEVLIASRCVLMDTPPPRDYA
jgi:hypothetical protein